MLKFRDFWIVLILSIACAGCRSGSQITGQTQTAGNSSVVLAVTDTPPSNVSILSAEVTLTGATLNPGNVSLFSGSTTIELTRLSTDIGYLATAANVPTGSYTSITLTFANPLLTIENDTTSPIVSGTTTCAVAAICTIAPVTTANLSTTVSLSAFTIASNSTNGLLVDVNLNNLLSATMGADFSAGTTVKSFIPSGTGAPQVGAEDVVGHVTSVNSTAGTFTLQNAIATYTLKVETASTFFQFVSCTTPSIACLQINQILSVDIGLLADGTLLARNIVFEDADSTDTEVEGRIVTTNLGLQQFTIVTLGLSSATTGLNIGNTATVQYTSAPQTPFDVDVVHADNVVVSTTGFSLTSPTQLAVGQEVSIRRNSASSGTTIVADRVRLRSTRVTATVQSIGAPNIYLYNLPSFYFGDGGIKQVQVQTSTQTIISEQNVLKTLTEVPVAGLISVRGPLFSTATTTLVATKVAIVP
jgi:hypothetical protein